jgi:hypothetical protein
MLAPMITPALKILYAGKSRLFIYFAFHSLRLTLDGLFPVVAPPVSAMGRVRAIYTLSDTTMYHRSPNKCFLFLHPLDR